MQKNRSATDEVSADSSLVIFYSH